MMALVTNMSYDGNSRLITTVAERRLEISQKAFLDSSRHHHCTVNVVLSNNFKVVREALASGQNVNQRSPSGVSGPLFPLL